MDAMLTRSPVSLTTGPAPLRQEASYVADSRLLVRESRPHLGIRR